MYGIERPFRVGCDAPNRMGGAGSPALRPGTAPDDPGTAGCSGAHGLRFGEEAVLREHADPAWRVARDDEAFVVDARVSPRDAAPRCGPVRCRPRTGAPPR